MKILEECLNLTMENMLKACRFLLFSSICYSLSSHFLFLSVSRWRSRARTRRCWPPPVKCSWASLRLRLLWLHWRHWRGTREPSLLIWLWRLEHWRCRIEFAWMLPLIKDCSEASLCLWFSSNWTTKWTAMNSINNYDVLIFVNRRSTRIVRSSQSRSSRWPHLILSTWELASWATHLKMFMMIRYFVSVWDIFL